MKLLKTKIDGPKIIKSQIFNDKRGYLRETFKSIFFKNLAFPFDVMSSSKRAVLRGLHIQIKESQNRILIDFWHHKPPRRPLKRVPRSS